MVSIASRAGVRSNSGENLTGSSRMVKLKFATFSIFGKRRASLLADYRDMAYPKVLLGSWWHSSSRDINYRWAIFMKIWVSTVSKKAKQKWTEMGRFSPWPTILKFPKWWEVVCSAYLSVSSQMSSGQSPTSSAAAEKFSEHGWWKFRWERKNLPGVSRLVFSLSSSLTWLAFSLKVFPIPQLSVNFSEWIR